MYIYTYVYTHTRTYLQLHIHIILSHYSKYCYKGRLYLSLISLVSTWHRSCSIKHIPITLQPKLFHFASINMFCFLNSHKLNASVLKSLLWLMNRICSLFVYSISAASARSSISKLVTYFSNHMDPFHYFEECIENLMHGTKPPDPSPLQPCSQREGASLLGAEARGCCLIHPEDARLGAPESRYLEQPGNTP